MRLGYFILSIFIISNFGLTYRLNGQAIYKVKQITSRANDDVVYGFTGDGIVYSSNRPLTSFLKYTDEENRNVFNIWEMSIDDEGNLGTPKLFAPELKTPQNDGPASLNGEGNTIVFTRNFAIRRFGNIRGGNPLYGLFFAEKVNGVWTNIREFEHNSFTSRTTHPALSADGTTLYFASDRDGGYGGFDLYVSNYENGSWTEPRNLGPNINTPQNDIYPYIHSSGRLYFSSDVAIK